MAQMESLELREMLTQQQQAALERVRAALVQPLEQSGTVTSRVSERPQDSAERVVTEA